MQQTTASSACGFAQLTSQLQEQLDTLLAAQRQIGHTKPRMPAAAVAASITTKAAALLQDAVKRLAMEQQEIAPALLAASVHAGAVQLSEQRQMLQGHVLQQLQQQLAAIQQQQEVWQQSIRPLFAQAGSAVSGARDACAALEAGCAEVPDAEGVVQLLLALNQQLAEALAAAAASQLTEQQLDSANVAGHCADAGQQGTVLPTEVQATCAAAEAAARHAGSVLLEVAGHLAGAAGCPAGGSAAAVSCAGSEAVQALASSIVQAESLLKDKARVSRPYCLVVCRMAFMKHDVLARYGQMHCPWPCSQ